MEVRMVFEFLKKYLSSSDADKDSG
ncbi:uncharacterized protein METZ01_LOCUS438862, partial [marine metagenome]